MNEQRKKNMWLSCTSAGSQKTWPATGQSLHYTAFQIWQADKVPSQYAG